MLVTEEEAKAKWCPLARPVVMEAERAVIVAQGRAAELQPDGKLGTVRQNCIASGCMSWRWATENTKDRIAVIKKRRADTGCTLREALDWADANPGLWQAEAARVYCGLSGKPE